MIRNIKALGLVALAALVVGATAAQAVPNGVYTAGITSPLTHTTSNLHGEQYGTAAENFFKTPASEFNCENTGVTFSGTISNGTATSMVAVPSYKDCTANGLPATIIINGCTYTLDQPEAIEGGDTTWSNTVDLVCPGGKAIELEVFLGGTKTAHNTKICTITILPANNMGQVISHNIAGAGGKKDDITVTADVSNIPVEEHGAACPDGNTKAVVGTYKNSVTLTGKNASGELDDVWVGTD